MPVRARNPLVPPRELIGYLFVQRGPHAYGYGTAALIDNLNILTCSHNLISVPPAAHAPAPLPPATDVRFYPGYNQQHGAVNPPAGPYVAIKAGFYHNLFANNGDRDWDIAVCRLAAPLPPPAHGAPPRFYFTPTQTGAEIGGRPLNLTGYPGPANGEMWEDQEPAIAIHAATNTVAYLHDTLPGNSGSPVWEYEALPRDVVRLRAVHVSGPNELRRGILMTAGVIAWINRAIATPTPAAAGFQLAGLP